MKLFLTYITHVVYCHIINLSNDGICMMVLLSCRSPSACILLSSREMLSLLSFNSSAKRSILICIVFVPAGFLQ